MDDSQVVERAVLRVSRRVYAALSASPPDLDSYQQVWANAAARSIQVVAPVLASWALTISSVSTPPPANDAASQVWAVHATRLLLAAQHGQQQRMHEAVTDACQTLDDAGIAGLLLEMGTAFTAAVSTSGGLTMLENAHGLFDGIAATDRERELIYDAAIITTAIGHGNPAAARQALAACVVRSNDPDRFLARLMGVLVRTALAMHSDTDTFWPTVTHAMTLPGGLDDAVTTLVHQAVQTAMTGDQDANARMAKRMANLDINGLTAACWYLALAVGTNLPGFIAGIYEAGHNRRTSP